MTKSDCVITSITCLLGFCMLLGHKYEVKDSPITPYAKYVKLVVEHKVPFQKIELRMRFPRNFKKG